MARKLPWAGRSEPEPKRVRTAERRDPEVEGPDKTNRVRTEARQSRIKTPAITPRRRRAGSRSPSTSPPPGPPDVEPMIEGYDEDDTWMMVEDEFQTLAQSFTAHLHHAEYKRLIKKAREAPRRELPEPTSPMSKPMKQKLQRQARDKSNRQVLDRMILGSQAADMVNNVEEDKVDDPWRGTALAGLIATGSTEKTSLKGLDKMPSSTRAAQGFAKAETKARTRKVDAIDLLIRPPEKREAMRNLPKNRGVLHNLQGGFEESHPMVVPKKRTMESSAAKHFEDDDHRALHGKQEVNDLMRNGSTSTANTQPNPSAPSALRQPVKPSSLHKRRKVKEESKEDRLAEVPMFLF